ncbi:unnamed protein product [Moneuplotes crassus]|uniref:BZIP domain-containing protein n=1 Tax=Euplotes crassus TaxID=5936 RepID=A0AAD1XH08_EUPCR|nr:unnamed protein product [Moneuplotes crassus]
MEDKISLFDKSEKKIDIYQEATMSGLQNPLSVFQMSELQEIGDKKQQQTVLEECEEESDNNEGVIPSIENKIDINSKREKGKIRSRKSRARKKAYIEQLEAKIEKLEAENFRLQNLLVSYRNDKLEVLNKDSYNFMQSSQGLKNQSLERIAIFAPSELTKNEKLSVYQDFEEVISKLIPQHRDFLDTTFEALINSPFPGFKMKHWGDLGDTPIKSFEVIQKYLKLPKTHIEDYKEEHSMTPSDIMIASLKPNKKQYNFLVNLFTRERLIMNKFKNGIKLLLEAKKIFEETIPSLMITIRYFLKSGIFTDEEIRDSKITEAFISKDNAYNDIWKIKVQRTCCRDDLADCPIVGKTATKRFRKKERIEEIWYNHFFMD